jgi:hypothetical protein
LGIPIAKIKVNVLCLKMRKSLGEIIEKSLQLAANEMKKLARTKISFHALPSNTENIFQTDTY